MDRVPNQAPSVKTRLRSTSLASEASSTAGFRSGLLLAAGEQRMRWARWCSASSIAMAATGLAWAVFAQTPAIFWATGAAASLSLIVTAGQVALKRFTDPDSSQTPELADSLQTRFPIYTPRSIRRLVESLAEAEKVADAFPETFGAALSTLKIAMDSGGVPSRVLNDTANALALLTARQRLIEQIAGELTPDQKMPRTLGEAFRGRLWPVGYAEETCDVCCSASFREMKRSYSLDLKDAGSRIRRYAFVDRHYLKLAIAIPIACLITSEVSGTFLINPYSPTSQVLIRGIIGLIGLSAFFLLQVLFSKSNVILSKSRDCADPALRTLQNDLRRAFHRSVPRLMKKLLNAFKLTNRWKETCEKKLLSVALEMITSAAIGGRWNPASVTLLLKAMHLCESLERIRASTGLRLPELEDSTASERDHLPHQRLAPPPLITVTEGYVGWSGD